MMTLLRPGSAFASAQLRRLCLSSGSELAEPYSFASPLVLLFRSSLLLPVAELVLLLELVPPGLVVDGLLPGPVPFVLALGGLLPVLAPSVQPGVLIPSVMVPRGSALGLT